MSKQNIFGQPFPTVSDGFIRGFAQMTSLGRVQPRSVTIPKSATDALRSDWVRIGGDMGRAIEKARVGGKTTKAK